MNDILTDKNQQMVLTQGGEYLHASIYQVNNVEYNIEIDDEEFTTYALERAVH